MHMSIEHLEMMSTFGKNGEYSYLIVEIDILITDWAIN